MKKISIYLFFLFTAGLLFSCGGTKTQELVSESSDKSTFVKVSGSRATSLDPFQARIVIGGYGQSDTLMTEIYAQDLNAENVKFEWADNSYCTLTFLQQDDSKRAMDIKFSEEGNSLREREVK